MHKHQSRSLKSPTLWSKGEDGAFNCRDALNKTKTLIDHNIASPESIEKLRRTFIP